ncbi:MAG: 1-acyl-sn-glycerol-3-phosphate acyltransferase [Myxococcaceae bacterium]|nr:1-acyl-sn-glycerol-3-phosphate acyltransferase [Myxococcaceae bacterium]
MDSALAQTQTPQKPVAVKDEFGPLMRRIGERYFEGVRFPPEAEQDLRRLHEQGFVVHVMRSTSWVNYLYLTWALLRRGMPPVRAVVNLRRWFTRPWKRTAQRGDFEVRFTWARRQGGSGLIFLRRSALGVAEGRSIKEDPFPALVTMARKSDRPVFLVPELFVWERTTKRISPRLIDRIFGSPDVPGFLHSVVVFWRNYHRAQFRIGEPINLRRFIDENPEDTDALIARKVRGALHQHLARETRAVFGPPLKPPARVIEETLRDRSLNRALEEVAKKTNRRLEAVQKEARRDLNAIAARLNPTVVGLSAPLLDAIFQKIYDGIEVDEAGFERAMRAASMAPVVLVPSHKSHIDYLVMSWVMWNRGYTVPLVAAGANLSFWPLGPFLRRGGAFFLRRSFKGDPVYTAAFKAYLKKLVHDGVMQEFFPEGGRSRTGKLLAPKLGMFTWLVDAVLEGARQDLVFVPVAIDYEKVVESSSYSRELAGGEKRPEDFKALLAAPKVLTARYGRIHLTFDQPVSLAEFAAQRGIDLRGPVDEEQKKGLVRALGHRVMWGIGRVSTITPQALVTAGLLAWRGRGIEARELGDRIGLLRRLAARDGTPVSSTLRNAPSDPTVLGAINEAIRTFCRDEMVRITEARGEPIYQAVDERRAELSFYKNTLMNWIAPRSLVANALLTSGGTAPVSEVKDRALFLSRLFKLEFVYRVGIGFDTIFDETVVDMEATGLVTRAGGSISIAPEPHALDDLTFLADLMRDYLESYLIAGLALEDLAIANGVDKKTFVKTALEVGRAEFLAGRITAAEAISRSNIENALAWFLDRQMVVERDKKLFIGSGAIETSQRAEWVSSVREYLSRTR